MISTWLWTGIQKGFTAMEDESMMLENFMEIPKGISAMLRGAGPYLLSFDQVIPRKDMFWVGVTQ